MKNLSIEEIAGAKDRVIRPVPMPEWGGTVHLLTMTGDEKEEWDAEQAELEKSSQGEADRQWMARFLLRILCDAEGALLAKPVVGANGRRRFAASALAALAGRSARSLGKLVVIGKRMNVVGDEEVRALLGNSEGGPTSASGTV